MFVQRTEGFLMRVLYSNYMTVVEHWTNGARDAFDTARVLFAAKKYNHALFFLHLAIEKALKALYVAKLNQPAPPIHKLKLLAEKLPVPISDTLADQLLEITTFNISARYDNEKFALYKKATPEYTSKWMSTGRQILDFLLSHL